MKTALSISGLYQTRSRTCGAPGIVTVVTPRRASVSSRTLVASDAPISRADDSAFDATDGSESVEHKNNPNVTPGSDGAPVIRWNDQPGARLTAINLRRQITF